MSDPQAVAGDIGAVAAALGAAFEAMNLSLFGIPAGAFCAAAAAATVPLLFADPLPWREVFKRWAGAAIFSITTTALVIYFSKLDRSAVVGVAALLAMFAQPIFAALKEIFPLIVTALRDRVARWISKNGAA